MISPHLIAAMAKAICCPPHGICKAPESVDHIKGRVGVCHARSYKKDAQAAITAYLAALKEQDYKVVPRKPTAEMLSFACEEHKPEQPMSKEDPSECPLIVNARNVWTAMWHAAPDYIEDAASAAPEE